MDSGDLERPPRSFWVKLQMVFAFLLAIAGTVGCPLFIAQFGNWYAGSAAFFLALVNANLFVMFFSVERRLRGDGRYNAYLQVSKLSGLALFFASFAGAVALFVMVGLSHEPVMSMKSGYFIGGIQALLVARSAATMFWYGRKYLRQDGQLLLEEEVGVDQGGPEGRAEAV